ncbi:hypothetical protein Tco_0921658, partial [Tanacetum coccineum]
MFNDDDDSGTRIELGSHKEHPKNINDDDEIEKDKKDDKKDDEKANDDEKKDETGSMETRKEKMQTSIPSPTRSPRKNLSSDKTLSRELTDAALPFNATTSKAQRKTRYTKYNHIPGVIRMMCRRQGYMIQRMEKKYVTDHEFWKVHGKVDKEDDDPPKEEKRAKRQKTSKSLKSSKSARVIDEDEEIPKDTTPELIDEITEVVRITTDQQYGLDYMEQIIMMRENGKPGSFSKADFKYL